MPDSKLIYDQVALKTVFLDDVELGQICGQRQRPQSDVDTFRLRLQPELQDKFLRKPAEVVPIDLELLAPNDDKLRVVKSLRELRRRWRNTVMVGRELYSPIELADRAVLDSDGVEIGEIEALMKVKRTFKGIKVRTRRSIQESHGLEASVFLPVDIMKSTRDMMDDVILTRPVDRLSGLILPEEMFEEGVALPAIMA